MTQTLIIAAREIRERTFVLLVALFIAAFPFLLASTPSSKRFGRLEMIAAVGTFGAAAFVFAVAIIVGASVVGRELTERRLSFYFARPVQGSTIWFGKLLGGLVLAVVSFAIIFIPSYLVGREKWNRAFSAGPAWIVGGSFIAILLLFLVAHAISTIIRSRSALAGVDLLAAAIASGVVWTILASLIQSLATGLALIVGWALLVALIAVLAGAGAWQLARGRADTKRNHIELSKFLWISIAIVLAVAGAYTFWVFSAEVDDLTDPTGRLSARGDFALVGGLSPLRGDYFSSFVLNVKEGTSVRLPFLRWSNPEFTRAGDAVVAETTRTAWMGKPNGEVVVYRFGRDERPVRTGIAELGTAVLSDDLSRVAVIGNSTVSIHEIDTRRIAVSAAMPSRRGGVGAFFVTPDILRMFIVEKGSAPSENVPITLRIFELNANTRQLVQTGSWKTTGAQVLVQASADGSTLLTNRFGRVEGSRLALLDARTGALKGELPAGTGGFLGASFLSNGRLAAINPEPERVLTIFAADGSPLRKIALGRAVRSRIAAELESEKVVVALDLTEKWDAESGSGWETVVVDLNTGAITMRQRDVVPIIHWWSTDPRTNLPNATGEILVADAAGKLWRWNTVTGEKKEFV